MAKAQAMVVRLDEFLRPRSIIAPIVRHQVIRQAPGLMPSCEILFGVQVQERFDEYFVPR